ncbi:MAG TPA: BlaI/MecI/CopY family transcriptional regulator [Gemmatimonadaceae bacterium]|nr:BlaI/MecI/CopY family transcriptional regulator [Gemmatimonadaceae bacterium]
MPQSHSLTDLQIDVMRALWKLGEATVADVHQELSKHRPLAHPTVATLLARLEKRGATAHRVEGRQFIYRAVIKEDEVKRSMLAQIKDSLFTGDVPALVNQLLSGRDISAADLEEVKALVAAKELELKKKNKRDPGKR